MNSATLIIIIAVLLAWTLIRVIDPPWAPRWLRSPWVMVAAFFALVAAIVKRRPAPTPDPPPRSRPYAPPRRSSAPTDSDITDLDGRITEARARTDARSSDDGDVVDPGRPDPILLDKLRRRRRP